MNSDAELTAARRPILRVDRVRITDTDVPDPLYHRAGNVDVVPGPCPGRVTITLTGNIAATVDLDTKHRERFES